MIQNQIKKNGENFFLDEENMRKYEKIIQFSKKKSIDQLNELIEDQDNNKKTKKKRIMIMRTLKKNRREKYLNNFSKEFLSLFDGYMLF